jgi:hypothetical protein
LLLVEAVLSAVVIAVGLVFVTRGLSSQLKALRTVEEYDALLSLAHGTLLRLESERLSGRPVPSAPTGTFEPPYQAYQWTIRATPRADMTDPEGHPLISEVILTVERASPPISSISLRAMWPNAWVPGEWL